MVEASLSNGPVFFNTFPDFSVSLTDPNIHKVLTLNLQTSGFNLEPGSENISVTYRIYYKAMTSLAPCAKQNTPKGLSTLLQANPRNNIITPKTLKWDEIKLPEKWTLTQAVEPQSLEQTEVQSVTETPDGDVEVTFSSKRKVFIQSRPSVSVDNRPQMKPQNIVYATYEDNSYEPSISDFEINVIEVDDPELQTDCIISLFEDEFEIDKELLRREISLPKNKDKMEKYFKNVDQPFRLKIREVWHKEMIEQKRNIFFFDWYENSQIRHFEEFFKPSAKKKGKAKINPESEQDLSVIKKVSKDWNTISGKQVESVHPPFESIQMEVNAKGDSTKACPLKNISKTTYGEPIKVEHIGHLVEQQNFANISLNTIGQQTDRIETILMEGSRPSNSEVKVNLPSSSQSDLPSTRIVAPPFISHMMSPGIKLGKQKAIGPSVSEDLINELANKLGSLKVNKNINQITDKENDMVNKIFKTSTQTSRTRNYYPRPTYADLQFEELPQISNMKYFNGKEIIEWNLDGLTEYQIFTLCHQMIMYANACIANGNKEKEAAQLIVVGFSGQLRGWWDHYLDDNQRHAIIEAVKLDQHGRPVVLVNEQGQSQGNVSDAISTLLYNIVYHFAGNYQDIYEKNREQLINLRCKTMSEFRWYRDSFLSKLYTLPDPNQDFWKEKYISGLPPLFAEKVRNSLRKEGQGSINYQNMDIGNITQKIQMVGAELCNDLKIKEQLKKQRVVGKREMGDFCYQFGFQDPYESRNKKTHRKPVKRHYDGQQNRRYPNKRTKYRKTYANREGISNKGSNSKSVKGKGKPNDFVCFKCGSKGHKANQCFKMKVKQEIQALLETDSEDVKEKLEQLLNHIHSDSSSDDENNSEINCCKNDECSCYEQDSTSEEESDEDVLVLTDLEQFVLDTFETVQDPEEKKFILEKFLSRIKNNKDKLAKEIQKRQFCSIDEVFKRVEDQKKKSKQLDINDLLKEQEGMKRELRDHKRRIEALEIKDQSSSEDEIEEETPQEGEIIGSIERYFRQKWYTEIIYKFHDGFNFKYNTLLDSGADVNCIREGIIPFKYFQKTTHKLHSADGNLLKVNYKIPEVNVCISGISIKTSFLLVENLKQGIILGTPFLFLIRPFMVTKDGIQFKIKGKEVELVFSSEPENMLNQLLETHSFRDKSINEIASKENQSCVSQRLMTSHEISLLRKKKSHIDCIHSHHPKEKSLNREHIEENNVANDQILATTLWLSNMAAIICPTWEKYASNESPFDHKRDNASCHSKIVHIDPIKEHGKNIHRYGMCHPLCLINGQHRTFFFAIMLSHYFKSLHDKKFQHLSKRITHQFVERSISILTAVVVSVQQKLKMAPHLKFEYLSHMDSWKLPHLRDGDKDRFNHNFEVSELQQGMLNLLWQAKNKSDKAYALKGLAYYFNHISINADQTDPIKLQGSPKLSETNVSFGKWQSSKLSDTVIQNYSPSPEESNYDIHNFQIRRRSFQNQNNYHPKMGKRSLGDNNYIIPTMGKHHNNNNDPKKGKDPSKGHDRYDFKEEREPLKASFSYLQDRKEDTHNDDHVEVSTSTKNIPSSTYASTKYKYASTQHISITNQSQESMLGENPPKDHEMPDPTFYCKECRQTYPLKKALSEVSSTSKIKVLSEESSTPQRVMPPIHHKSTPYEFLIPRLSFKTDQMLSCLGPDIISLIWKKYHERQMRLFQCLQNYFMDLYKGKEKHQGITIDTHTFPLLHLDDKLIIKPHHKYLILEAIINLKNFRNLQIHPIENLSLQTLIDQGLVHIIYGTLDEILHSNLGKAIKEACKKLSYLQGRYKIIFYSIPPKFTPPIRPATHDIYITKGCFTFSNTYMGSSELSQEYEEMFSKDTNHDNWRTFNEAKEVEGNVKFDPTYYMIYQNKIMKIFLREHHGSYGTITRGVGRLIKPDYGKDTCLRKEYRELLSWYETWQPDEIDGTESAQMLEYNDD